MENSSLRRVASAIFFSFYETICLQAKFGGVSTLYGDRVNGTVGNLRQYPECMSSR